MVSQGSVVIVGTGQAGTVVEKWAEQVMVLLTNGEIWYGSAKHTYIPDADVLALAPLEVDRFEGREKPMPSRPKQSRREDYQD